MQGAGHSEEGPLHLKEPEDILPIGGEKAPACWTGQRTPLQILSRIQNLYVKKGQPYVPNLRASPMDARCDSPDKGIVNRCSHPLGYDRTHTGVVTLFVASKDT